MAARSALMWVDFGDESNEKVDREGESGSPIGSGAVRLAPAGLERHWPSLSTSRTDETLLPRSRGRSEACYDEVRSKSRQRVVKRECLFGRGAVNSSSPPTRIFVPRYGYGSLVQRAGARTTERPEWNVLSGRKQWFVSATHLVEECRTAAQAVRRRAGGVRARRCDWPDKRAA